jgi:acyl transferase domain-containing protein/NADPH:quinone reductase-like Zn-dependent oxidoreductase/SAM-dependent methyltransferase
MDKQPQETTPLSALKQAYLGIERLQARLDAVELARREPIAVVGFACRLPGSANDAESFWRILRDGVDAIGEVPPDRWDIDAYYDPDPNKPGKMNTRWGGFVNGIDHFDPQLFGVSPREAGSMDPQQRILLEVAWEALEDAGQAPDRLSGSSTGVFVGIVNNDYASLQLAEGGIERIDTYFGSGVGHSLASGRISYVFGLQGPSLSIDTACSSSLAAVHLAVQSLRTGECSMALAGGTNAILSPEVTIALSKFNFMAPDGRCKAFDARADGFVRGEGCGLLVLKRLSDALAAGDPINALILGSAVDQDGASSGLTAPNGPSQELVVRQALQNAGLEPAEVSYIEAHGTGTSLGDPIEAQALGNVFQESHSRDNPLWMGSVKTNLGHLESAAGIAGLIKVILALKHGEIPASLHFETPNPHIPWERLPVRVPTSRMPWKPNGRRVAGVSSFGFSGTNAHVILAGVPSEEPVPSGPERPYRLLTLSTQSENSLPELAGRFKDYLNRRPEQRLADICVTTNQGRAQLDHRLAVVASSTGQAAGQLELFQAGDTSQDLVSGSIRTTDRPKIAFLFTGQGSQYLGMARTLYETQPVFRDALDRCSAQLELYLERPLLSVIFSDDDGSPHSLDETTYTQPALFALEYGLAELWRSWGIEPSAVMGHSAGEYVAACVAGVFSLEDGLKLIARRSRLMGSLPAGGGMAAVIASEEVVASALDAYRDKVSIAALNGPENTVISGEEGALQAVLGRLKAKGVKSRRLNVSHAFHSPLMDTIRDDFAAVAGEIAYRRPRLQLISNLTGKPAPGDAMARSEYWLEQLRQPVRFAQGMSALHQMGHQIFLEIGPTPTLLGMGQRCLPEGIGMWLPSLRKDRDDWKQLLHSLGQLYVYGAQVNWEGVNLEPSVKNRRLSLPTYPFQRKRYWFSEGSRLRSPKQQAGKPAGPLVGSRLRSALDERQYENYLVPEDLPFLADHVVFGDTVLPAAAYFEFALEAAVERYGPGKHILEDLIIHEPMVFIGEGGKVVQTILAPETPTRSEFKILSASPTEDDKWQLHMTGKILAHSEEAAPKPNPPSEISSRFELQEHPANHYRRLQARGIHLGPSLQALEAIHWREAEAFGQVRLAENQPETPLPYHIHPVLIDACLQLLEECLPLDPADTRVYLPVAVDRFRFFRSPGAVAWGFAELRPDSRQAGGTLVADVRMLDEDGETLVELEGLRLRLASGRRLESQESSEFADWLYRLEWELNPKESPGSDNLPVASKIAAQLKPQIQELSQRYDLASQAESISQLNLLSTAYIMAALDQLGWQAKPGQRIAAITLAAELGVSKKHYRLFERFLAILAEDGYLQREGLEWRVKTTFELEDIAELEQKFTGNLPETHFRIVQRCGRRLAEALSGEQDPLQLLFPGGSLEDVGRLYQETPEAQVFNTLLQEAVKSFQQNLPEKRNLRVLEIGAGTGSSTSFVLPALSGDTAEYLFTDISTLFLSQARQKFAQYPFMDFRTLDIERDPTSQGVEPGVYDFILASNVLHATTDLKTSLEHIKGLLAPGGILALLEATGPERWIDITFGLTEGWWSFSDVELRPDYPLLSGQAWLDLLTENGISQAVSFQDSSGNSRQAMILANAPAALPPASDSLGDWLVFANRIDLGTTIASLMASNGENCHIVLPGPSSQIEDGCYVIDPARPESYTWLLDTLSERSLKGVVHLWSMDIDPASETDLGILKDRQSLGIEGLLYLVQALGASAQTPHIWVATRGAQPIEPLEDLRSGAVQALAWGLGRVIRLEHPEYECKLLDLDPADSIQIQARQVFDEISSPDAEEQIAYRQGQRYTSRLKRVNLPDRPASPSTRSRRLLAPGNGALDDLRIVPAARTKPGPREAEIQVLATGLNFRDVLNALAMRQDSEPLGSECAGTVTAVGQGVSHLNVGDQVMAVASGGFASYVTVKAGLAARIPAQIDAQQAATFPMAFMTAYYSLNRIANLSPGERVLIHAAAGGVGQAALQIAMQAGAEVFATAGSPEKRAYLETQGVRHIFDSRSLEFAAEILTLTDGEGVDVILNSLAGDFIPASISVLAENGRFLEIGKNDIWSQARFESLKPEAAYHIVDLAAVMVENPLETQALFREVMAEIEAGRFAPLPYHAFSFEDAPSAFRFMAQARHIGKIVLTQTHPEAGDESQNDNYNARQRSSIASPDPEAAYLITGGLSGLGLLVAQQMVTNGARYITVAGRSRPSEFARQAISQMESAGAHIHIAACDVSDPDQVKDLLNEIQTRMPPLRGVVHSAGVLDDGALLRQDWPRFVKVMASKVDGSWNLHALTSGLDLDFFVLFSSTAALLGSAGQANHAAANAFMDSLAHLRRAEGLPALSINWGVWSEVGLAAAHNVGERVEAQGIGTISPRQGLKILEQITAQELAQVGVFSIDWEQFINGYPGGRAPTWLSEFKSDGLPKASRLDKGSAQVKSTLPDIRSRLADVPPHKQYDLLLSFVGEQILKVLGLDTLDDIDLHKPLHEMGLDSLMAVELRNLLSSGLQLERSLPATLAFDYPTLEALTGYLAKQVLTQVEAIEIPSNGGKRSDSVDDLLAALEDLPEDEIERLFTDQLRGK